MFVPINSLSFSQIVNRFTLLDAYPLPRTEDIVNKLSKDKYYTSLNLRSAYHQVSIRKNDQPFTACEALGRLYQYKKLPFGVTNGVVVF